MRVISRSPRDSRSLRVVASLTTIPNRINLIQPVLKSIYTQSYKLDEIYLNIPMKSEKGGEYCIPDFVYDYCTVLRPEIDYGPITKLIPTLKQESDPETVIITFDDDIVVYPHTVEKFLEKHKRYPHAALSFSGFCVGDYINYLQPIIFNVNDTEVDWIQGTNGILYKREFIDVDEILKFPQGFPEFLLHNDDHWISGYLAKKKIKRISIGGNPDDYFKILDHNRIDAISLHTSEFWTEVFAITMIFMWKGIYNKNWSIYESIGFWVFIAIIILIIILLFAFN